MHLKLKSYGILFAKNLFLMCQIKLEFCTEHNNFIYNICYFSYQKWYQAILTLHLFGMMDTVYKYAEGRNGIVFHQTMEQINH